MPVLTVLAAAALAAAILLGPFTVLINCMPVQRLLLFQAETIGGNAPRFTDGEALRRLHDLLRYLAFRRPLPNDGFYSALERVHMSDVQAIFQIVYGACGISLLLTWLLLLYLRHRGCDTRKIVRAAGFFILAVIMILGSFTATNGFDTLFILFHHLAFTNDFWLLPGDAALIRLFPESYFMNCFFLALGTSAAVSLLLLVQSYRCHPA